VKKAILKNGRKPVAVKCFVNAGNLDELLQEYKLNLEMDFSLFVEHLVYIVTDENVYVVQELMTMDLRKFIRTNKNILTPAICLQILKSILLGLKFLHDKKNIIHLDIKPENILLLENKEKQTWITKISDFGTSIKMRGNDQSLPLRSIRGTEFYLPPEVLKMTDFMTNKHKFGYFTDIYAFGLVMYELWFGVTITEEINIGSLLNGRLKIPDEKATNEIDLFIWECIKNCIDEDFSKRPTADSVLKTLCEFPSK